MSFALLRCSRRFQQLISKVDLPPLLLSKSQILYIIRPQHPRIYIKMRWLSIKWILLTTTKGGLLCKHAIQSQELWYKPNSWAITRQWTSNHRSETDSWRGTSLSLLLLTQLKILRIFWNLRRISLSMMPNRRMTKLMIIKIKTWEATFCFLIKGSKNNANGRTN